jgi:hypothetical protein
MNFLKFSSVGGTPTKVSKLSFFSLYVQVESRGGPGGKDKQASSTQKRTDRVDADLLLAIFRCQTFCCLEDVLMNRMRGRRWDRDQTFATAALLALYQTRPGLGRVAPIDAILITEPPSP